MSLSVCILTKNEQENISKAIKSVKDIADEIIVLDTGSTDNTLDICRDLIVRNGRDRSLPPIKIFQTNWTNDFSEARNKLLSFASMDWVLMIDADETFAPESIDVIKELTHPPAPSLQLTLKGRGELKDNSVYAIKSINFYDSPQPVEIFGMKLLPNNGTKEFRGVLHEYPVNKDGSELVIKKLDNIKLFHNGYTEKAEEKKKFRNLKILDDALNSKNDDLYDKINVLSYAIIESLKLGETEKLSNYIFSMGKILSSIPARQVYYYPMVHLSFIYYLKAISNLDNDIFNKYLEYALHFFPNSVQIMEIKAIYFFNQRKFDNSLKIFLEIESILNNDTFYRYSDLNVNEAFKCCYQKISYCYGMFGNNHQKLFYLNKLNH